MFKKIFLTIFVLALIYGCQEQNSIPLVCASPALTSVCGLDTTTIMINGHEANLTTWHLESYSLDADGYCALECWEDNGALLDSNIDYDDWMLMSVSPVIRHRVSLNWPYEVQYLYNDCDSFDLQDGYNYAFEMMVKIYDVYEGSSNPDSASYLFEQHSDFLSRGCYLQILGAWAGHTEGQLRVTCYHDDEGQGECVICGVTERAIVMNSRTHILLQLRFCDCSNLVDIYVDGVCWGSWPAEQMVASIGGGRLTIGKMHGDIDWFRRYKFKDPGECRGYFTADQVKELYTRHVCDFGAVMR